jgi:hypothetical protein
MIKISRSSLKVLSLSNVHIATFGCKNKRVAVRLNVDAVTNFAMIVVEQNALMEVVLTQVRRKQK